MSITLKKYLEDITSSSIVGTEVALIPLQQRKEPLLIEEMGKPDIKKKRKRKSKKKEIKNENKSKSDN